MLQGRGNNTTNSNILTSQKSMGERSKTLGPGFMRGHHHNTVVFLNYHNAAYTITEKFFFSPTFYLFSAFLVTFDKRKIFFFEKRLGENVA